MCCDNSFQKINNTFSSFVIQCNKIEQHYSKSSSISSLIVFRGAASSAVAALLPYSLIRWINRVNTCDGKVCCSTWNYRINALWCIQALYSLSPSQTGSMVLTCKSWVGWPQTTTAFAKWVTPCSMSPLEMSASPAWISWRKNLNEIRNNGQFYYIMVKYRHTKKYRVHLTNLLE